MKLDTIHYLHGISAISLIWFFCMFYYYVS